LKDKPDLANIVSCDLPDKVFYESSTPFRCLSPTGFITTRQTSAESVNALAAARMPDLSQVKHTEKKIEGTSWQKL
jgi:hypothetical protein